MDIQFKELVKKGTAIGKEKVIDKELYRQYLVLYNVIDKREYNIPKGGITDRIKNYRTANLKSRLWSHPIYRVLVKTLKTLKLWEPLKNSKLNKKIIKL